MGPKNTGYAQVHSNPVDALAERDDSHTNLLPAFWDIGGDATHLVHIKLAQGFTIPEKFAYS
jgi:hypothetical protein